MKILHIIPNLNKGGAERLVIDIVSALKKRESIEIQLVLFRNEIKYDIKEIESLVKIIPASVQLSIWKKNTLEIDVLQNFINNFQPDIIHSHLFEAEIVSRSCYYLKAVWFSHCHDNMVQFKNFSLGAITNKTLLTNYFEKKYLLKRYQKNQGTHFIAISKDAENYFKETIHQYPITLLNNAINFDRFYKKKTFSTYKSTIKLVNVGSFVAKKNQAFILAIAEKLKTKNIDFEIHLLGDGKLKESLEAITKKMNLDTVVFFHGNVNNVEEYLWQSDIYLHTATYEPLGLVLIEAMAAGLPVITLDGKGNRDLIEEGKNGYMIQEQDAEWFANTILDLWSKKEKYQQISTFAQEYAKQYDIKNYVDNLLQLYKNALDKKL